MLINNKLVLGEGLVLAGLTCWGLLVCRVVLVGKASSPPLGVSSHQATQGALTLGPGRVPKEQEGAPRPLAAQALNWHTATSAAAYWPKQIRGWGK